MSADTAAVLAAIERMRGWPCPECDGDGWTAYAVDGRRIACEICGGHEDSLGSGVAPGVAALCALADAAALLPDTDEP